MNATIARPAGGPAGLRAWFRDDRALRAGHTSEKGANDQVAIDDPDSSDVASRRKGVDVRR
ncbi:MAG: hypothetical protein ACKV2O_07960 [Acidimicrobiales bacterium]